MQIYKRGCDKGGFQPPSCNQTSCYGPQSPPVHRHLKGLTSFGSSGILFLSKTGLLFLMWRHTVPLLLNVLPHIVLTFIFVGGEREPWFDLWNLFNPWSNASFIHHSENISWILSTHEYVCIRPAVTSTCSQQQNCAIWTQEVKIF